MKFSSKEYYKRQKNKSVKHWEKHRKNRFLYALKRGIIDALLYGIGIYFVVIGIPSLDDFNKISVAFSIVLLLMFTAHYFISFRLKEKYYQKTKQELDL